jgi:protein SCO1/2
MKTDGRLRPPAIAATLLCAALLGVAIGLLVHLGSDGAGTTSVRAATTSEFTGAQLPEGTRAPGFALTDQAGRTVSLASYRGRVVVLSFLYAGCVPGCVLIAQQIRGALDELARPVTVLIVSVDPVTDTRARVSAFLHQVGLAGRVEYLTGTARRLAPVWRAYHVVPPSAGRHDFEETAPVYLIDRRGEESVLYEEGELTPESLAHDIGKLQEG